MEKSLVHLPQNKQDELNLINKVILEKVSDVRMVILFGSYARGNWVEDTHFEDNAFHVYESDFDILVATKSKKDAESFDLHDRVEKAIEATGAVHTPCSIIYHTFSYICERIEEGHYFFTDIQKEGIYLFRTEKHKIGALKTLSPEKRKQIAQEHFNHWFEKTKRFYGLFEVSLEKNWNNEAAFNLHQATESLYSAITLVFVNYRFRTHDLDRLSRKAVSYHPDFAQAFPRETKEQEILFELLRRAYIDARYKDTYQITCDQLEQLAASVRKLQKLTETICKKKINSFV